MPLPTSGPARLHLHHQTHRAIIKIQNCHKALVPEQAERLTTNIGKVIPRTFFIFCPPEKD